MTESEAVPVGPAAWIQLLHAEVCWSLREAGVRALVIKGPTIAEWLYPGEERVSADADIMVSPGQYQAAVAALVSRGFVDYAEGVHDAERTPHAVTFTRTDPQVGGHTVDLHHYFPGIEVDPGVAFESLWSGRTEAQTGGVAAWFPDLPSRLLIIVLHAARGALTPKVLEDQRRAWELCGVELFTRSRELAEELDALAAFRVGLECVEETRHLVGELGLEAVPVPAHWALWNQGASGTAVHLEEALQRPWRERPAFVGRWLFPSPATMRLRDASVGAGGLALTKAYAGRLRMGLRSLPGAVRAVRNARGGG
ncbi:MAG: nucleotidyltransferase family protein [Actinomycetia bacterium]|nr:nucleotidyltransferase family protein [Actinomycetes bacterium]